MAAIEYIDVDIRVRLGFIALRSAFLCLNKPKQRIFHGTFQKQAIAYFLSVFCSHGQKNQAMLSYLPQCEFAPRSISMILQSPECLIFKKKSFDKKFSHNFLLAGFDPSPTVDLSRCGGARAKIT